MAEIARRAKEMGLINDEADAAKTMPATPPIERRDPYKEADDDLSDLGEQESQEHE